MSKDTESPPLMHFRNPKTGMSVWPVMKKDSEGNWTPSAPDAIKSLMRDDYRQGTPNSGKKQSSPRDSRLSSGAPSRPAKVCLFF